ncbi:MAG: hypothetical protein ACI30X_04205 [Muribaculaceae bacterium]
MAVGDIPVTIGVFLQPGVVYGDDAAVLRYNRSNDCYARCIRVTAPVKGSRPASQGQG